MNQPTTNILERRIKQALGENAADLVIRNVTIFHLTTCEKELGDIAVCGDTIVGVGERYEGQREIDGTGLVAVPGFIDSHVHVESSMMTPPEFERCVLPHGVTTAVCDPHELANVVGTAAFDYFFDCAARMCMDLKVQVSSCVPATPFETSGAAIDAAATCRYEGRADSCGLAELMNVPGVLNCELESLAKAACFYGEIDGHAPLLGGKALNAYLASGVRNCHESSNLGEAQEKLRKGMHVLIREGSVARNLDTLAPLITIENAPFLAFCTDDRNPLDIAEQGHLDYMIARAIALGASPLAAYRIASFSAAQHFRMFDRGLIAPGYRADIVLLSDLKQCRVEKVLKNGQLVDDALFAARELPAVPAEFCSSVKRRKVTADVFQVTASDGETDVIGIKEFSLLTDALRLTLPLSNGLMQCDPTQDVARIAVLERHGKNGNVEVGFVKGFQLTRGAIASSVGHDSHNICVVGVNEDDMALAVNALLESQGGFAVAADGAVLDVLPLPVGGLMSELPFDTLEMMLRKLHAAAKMTGCPLETPFLQLAFLALPVIPALRLTDRGVIHVG